MVARVTPFSFSNERALADEIGEIARRRRGRAGKSPRWLNWTANSDQSRR
jgi:hypothetical protein